MRATQVAAIEALSGIRATVESVYTVDEKQAFSTYRWTRAKLRWDVPDGWKHTVGYALQFTATGHNCTSDSFVDKNRPAVDADRLLVLGGPVDQSGHIGSMGAEVLGPGSVEREYSAQEPLFATNRPPTPTGFTGSLTCETYSNIRDTQIRVTSLDGVQIPQS